MNSPVYPLRHISIRVPWHDLGWNGTVCKVPKLNGACLKLDNIARNRNDNAEAAVAGQSIEHLEQRQWPCCVSERGTFMAPFEYMRSVQHTYEITSPLTHGHFDLTSLRHPPYSAPAIPFSWMLQEKMKDYGSKYGIDIDQEREPKLPFHTYWVQDHRNQRALLDCFFQQVRPEESLCFFYAKQVPFVEDSRRVIVAVGRVKHIGQCIEYKYKKPGNLRCMVWERMVQHSIRPDFKDGFLLPYHAALELAQTDPDFDPAEIAAFAPDDRIEEFSYATEHVTHDGAIASLLACATSLNKAKQYIPGPWERCLKWIDARLAELWKMRGPCPGLSAALRAFGVELGTFIAREIAAKIGDNEDPWSLVDRIFKDPKANLSPQLASQIGITLQKTWQVLPIERQALLKLLSRFEITPEQAKVLYVEEERAKASVSFRDLDIIENPYLIYELTRHTAMPISVWTVDRGVFPDACIREKHPLPEPSVIDAGTNERRVRALAVEILAQAASEGNTLLPQKDVILNIRSLEISPTCEVNQDIMTVAEDFFPGSIELVEMDNGARAYQLHRLSEMGKLIRNVVNKRIKGNRHQINADWRALLDEYLLKSGPQQKFATADAAEDKARQEKAAALKELASSRLSVLIGPAGTGKTTLLSVLCGHSDIAASTLR